MAVLKRNKQSGKLTVNHLDLDILVGELYSLCKTEREVEWLRDILHSTVDHLADEKTDEIGKGDED
jgi:hypothetical protein